MVLKIIGILMISAVLFFMVADIENLLEDDNINGEIIKAHATPEVLMEGQPENFEVIVRNLGNFSNFKVEVQRDSQIVAYHNFNFNNANIKIINLRSTLPPVRGKYVYQYILYPGIVGGTNTPINSTIENRRIYSQKELSDEDGDGIRYYEELEIGTNPDLSDTDRDGMRDDVDMFPTKAPKDLI